jgi:hypothetical protein
MQHGQRWACCAEERKSVSFVEPQGKHGFSKAQLRSLSFELLDTIFKRNFYDCI